MFTWIVQWKMPTMSFYSELIYMTFEHGFGLQSYKVEQISEPVIDASISLMNYILRGGIVIIIVGHYICFTPQLVLIPRMLHKCYNYENLS